MEILKTRLGTLKVCEIEDILFVFLQNNDKVVPVSAVTEIDGELYSYIYKDMGNSDPEVIKHEGHKLNQQKLMEYLLFFHPEIENELRDLFAKINIEC